MITLDNFESKVDVLILNRGKQYYRSGYVTDVEKSGKYEWHATVKGSDHYYVKAEIQKNVIVDCSCDCPHENKICKHLVALFYTLKGEVAPVAVKIKSSFDELLDRITVEEYKSFVQQYALTDKKFKAAFEIRFIEKNNHADAAQKFADLSRMMIRKHTQNNFIDYKAVLRLSTEFDELSAMCRGFLKRNNYQEAFALAGSALKEMVHALPICDDYGGEIRDDINSMVAFIAEIVEVADAELKEKIFLFLITELKNDLYFQEYDNAGPKMINILTPLALQLNKSDEFLKFADQQINRNVSGKDLYLAAKLTHLNAAGKTEDASELIAQHMDVKKVRLEAIEQAIIRRDFSTAKTLIGESQGMEEILLRIAELEDDVKNIRHYTKYLAFNVWFNEGHYRDWKSTYTSTEWKKVIDAHIAALHKSDSDMLADVYIQEKYWDRLLKLVQEGRYIDNMLSYHSYLIGIYPDELLAAYLPALELMCEEASKRRQYVQLADTIKTLLKTMPKAKAQLITFIKAMMDKYPRRAAMTDELKALL